MGDLTLENIRSLLIENSKDIKQELSKKIEETSKQQKLEILENFKNLEERVHQLERKIKSNNIAIFGFHPSDPKKIVEETIFTINKYLKLDLTVYEINNIYKRGRSDRAPIIVEFLSYHRKAQLFKDVENLRKLKADGISLANDLCPQDREDQKILVKHLKDCKVKNIQCKIQGFKLKIGDTFYTALELQERERQEHCSDTECEETTEGENTEQEQEENGEDTKNGKVKRKPLGSPKISPLSTRNGRKKPKNR